MRLIRHRFFLRGLFAAGLLASATLFIGCGDPVPATVPADEAYVDNLAGRYDRLFPDDRVQTVRIVMKDKDWKALKASVVQEEYYRADIWIDGERVPDVAVRPKGNSSLRMVAMSGSTRVGLKVDMNFFNSARSYHGVKKLNYNNGFSDPTFMKEFLGYELMAEMGIPTPRACFVDLWVNDTHLGLYTQVEQVDARFLAENFEDPKGNLYKPEIFAGTLDWTEKDVAAEKAPAPASGAAASGPASGTTSTTASINIGGGDLEEIISRLGEDAGWIPGRTTITTATQQGAGLPGGGFGGGFPGGGLPGGMFGPSDYLVAVGLKTNENSPNYSGLYTLLATINQDPAATTRQDLERVLQVDECLRFLAVSVALVHLDNYIGMGHNYYLYEDGGKFWLIPWDLNMSFGGFAGGLSREHLIDFYIDEPTSGKPFEYPLVAQLVAKPEYRETYHRYLQEIIDGPFSVEHMKARIEQIAALIRPYVEKDDLKFFTLEDFERALTDDLTSGTAQLQAMGARSIGLLSFVEGRDASIQAQLSGQEPAASTDGSGNGGSKGLGGPGGPGGPGFPGGDAAGGGVPGGGAGMPPGFPGGGGGVPPGG